MASVRLLLAAFIVFAVACGGSDTKKDDAPSDSSGATSQPVATSTPAPAKDACSAGGPNNAKVKIDQVGLVGRRAGGTAPTPAPTLSTATTFPATTSAINAQVKLAAGSDPTWVVVCWRYQGEPLTVSQGGGTPDGVINLSLASAINRMPLGSYEAAIMPIGSETRTLKFEVVAAAPAIAATRPAGTATTAAATATRPAGTSAPATAAPSSTAAPAVKPALASAGIIPTSAWDPRGQTDLNPLFVSTFEVPAYRGSNTPGITTAVRTTGGDAWVRLALSYAGSQLMTRAFTVAPNAWSDLRTPLYSAEPGEYGVEVALLGTNDRRSLRVNVTQGGQVTSPAKLGETALGRPQPSGWGVCGAMGKSFIAGQPVSIYYTLAGGSTAPIVTRLKYAGFELPEPGLTLSTHNHLSWGASPTWLSTFVLGGHFDSPPAVPGNYELTVTLPGSKDTRTLPFTVVPASAKQPAKIEQAGIVVGWDGCTPPTGLKETGNTATLADTASRDPPQLVLKLSDGLDVALEISWKHDGRPYELPPPRGGTVREITKGDSNAGGYFGIYVPHPEGNLAGLWEGTVHVPETGETKVITLQIN